MEIVAARKGDEAYIAERLGPAAGVCRRWVALDSGRRVGCARLGSSALGYWADLDAEGGEPVAGALHAALLDGARARGARTLTVRPLLDASDPRAAQWEALGYDERVSIRRWRLDVERALYFAERFCRASPLPSGAAAVPLDAALIPRAAVLRGRALGGDFPSIERRLRDPEVADAYDLGLCRGLVANGRLAAVWLARSLSDGLGYLESMVVAPGLRVDWPMPWIAKAGLEAARHQGKPFLEAETSRSHVFLARARRGLVMQSAGTKLRLTRRLAPPSPAVADAEAPVIAVIGLPSQGANELRGLLHELGLRDAPDTHEGWVRRIPQDASFWERARGRLILLPPALDAGLPPGVPLHRMTARDGHFVLELFGRDRACTSAAIETKRLLRSPVRAANNLREILLRNGIALRKSKMINSRSPGGGHCNEKD